ncbi:MAG: hypothetical protein WCX85_00035 [Bacilli bacterium]|nr:hypothetical protein [Bacilli bacterium]
MKYQHPETSLVTIIGPDQTTWIGDIKVEILFNGEIVGVIKGQKSAQFEINEDTRFSIRTVNEDLPKLEVSVAGLLCCPATIKLFLVGGSLNNAKLVAKTTYGEKYSNRRNK